MKHVNTLFVIILLKRDAGKHIEKKRQTDTESDRQTDRQTKISPGIGCMEDAGDRVPQLYYNSNINKICSHECWNSTYMVSLSITFFGKNYKVYSLYLWFFVC